MTSRTMPTDLNSPMQKILIVDDDHLVADTLSVIFERSGFASEVSYSADEGLRSARRFLPDLLLCDICMPGRDGLSLIKNVSEEMPSCQILVFTGSYARIQHVKACTAELRRPVSLATKPCPPEELIRRATQMLANA
ncbi:MAG TPA: response regulator [Edaphobacter sp.]|nr:response regulator [Edaphobacter sp.]